MLHLELELKMNIKRLLLAILITAGWIAPGLFNDLPVQALTIASIGDSYASGEGNPDKPQTFKFFGDVEKGPVWEEDRQCHRSRYAGPYMAAHEIARMVKQPLTFIGLACRGAQVPAGLLGPFDPKTDDRVNPVPAQIDQLKAKVGSGRIDLLLISIGGNDMGFADLIKKCIKLDAAEFIGFPGALCRHSREVVDALRADQAALPGKYDRLAQELGTMDIGSVFIAEYPDPTKGADGKYCGDFGNSRILLMHPETVRWAYHNVIKPLNAAIHAAAAKHGWIVVPMMDVSAKHGYCAGKARWFVTEEEARFIQGPYEFGFSERDRLPAGSISDGSLHPNLAGHLTYARQIVATALPVIGTLISGVPVREQSRDEIYVIYGGAKFYIPNQPTLERLFGRNPTILTVPDGALDQVPVIPSDGTLLRELGDGRVHVIYSGAKFYIPDPPTLERFFGKDPTIVTVPDGALTQVPLVPRDGTLIKELDGRIHVVYGGVKFYISDQHALHKLFGSNPTIVTVPDGALAQVSLVPHDGMLIRELTDGRVHVTYGGAKFYIPDPPTLDRLFGCNPTIVTVPDGGLTQVPLVPRDGTLIKELDDRIHVTYGGAKFYIPDQPTLQRLFGNNPMVVTVPDGAMTQVPLVPRDGTLIKELDDRIHVVYAGAKFYIRDQQTLQRLFGRNPTIVTVPDGALAQVPLVPRDGTLIRELTEGRVHVVYGGAKFHIPDPPTLERFFGKDPTIVTVPDGALTQVPLVPRDGTLIKELDDRIHVVYGEAKFYIPDQRTLQQLFGSSPKIVTVSDRALEQVPLIPRDGTLVRELTDGRVHVIYGEAKFYIPDPPTLERLFGSNPGIVTVPGKSLDQVQLVPRDGTLIKELTDQKIYLIRNGTKYWISSPEEFRRLGLAEADVKTVPDGSVDAWTGRDSP